MSTVPRVTASACCLLLSATVTWAGGPLAVFEPTGEPFRWDVGSGPVVWNPDQGGLGVLSNADAVAFTSLLFQTWEDIPTSSIAYAPGAPLADDVDTVPELIAAFNDPTVTPIVFDEDGSLFDDLFGPDSGVLGFAGPNFVDLPAGRPTIVTGVAALDGGWIDGDPANGEIDPQTFGAVFFHEFGHMSGLDHSQVNGIKFLIPSDNPGNPVKQIDAEYVETMFPFLVTGAQVTPHRDDVAHISALYPDGGATGVFGPGDTADDAAFGVITGEITFADELTPLQGINVIARNVNDKLGDAVAFVSGSTYSGNRVSIDFNPAVPTPFGAFAWFDIGPFPGLGPAENVGFYALNNLQPGARYEVEVEEVQVAFTGGSGVGPQSPPLEPRPGDGGGFVQLDAWNNHESGSSLTDNPQAANPIRVNGGQISSGYDIHVNDVHPDPAEPNDDLGSATPLVLGVSTGGAMIHPVGDVDVYSFTLDAPTSVVIETDFQTPVCCFNEIDTVVAVYDGGGSLLLFGDDDDVAAGFTRIPETGTEPDGVLLPAGTYFVKVTTFPDLYNELLAALVPGFPLLPTDYDETSIGLYSVSVTPVP